MTQEQKEYCESMEAYIHSLEVNVKAQVKCISNREDEMKDLAEIIECENGLLKSITKRLITANSILSEYKKEMA